MTPAIKVLVDVADMSGTDAGLRVAIAVKDEFLGLVSHELRTPVTTILGNATLLANRTDIVEPVGAMLRDLATDAERLATVVENLLVLSRAGTQMGMDPEPQVLDRCVREAVAGFRGRHPERVVHVSGDAGGGVVNADRAHLDLLLANLLGNANKYSPAGAPIEVVLGAHDGSLDVRILDRGIGFPPDEAAALFAPFFRTDAAPMMASGLGIGLSACRLLVELLHGRIWALRRPGGGSEFGFGLPAATEALDEPPPNRLVTRGGGAGPD